MKKIVIALCMGMAVLVFGGCGEQIPDMTDEQREAVSEYAVELLLKYDAGQTSRLVDLPVSEETETEQPAATEEPVATTEPVSEPEESALPETEETVEPEITQAPLENMDSVEDTMLLPETVTLEFCDYQVVDSYTDPLNDSLTLDAEQGNKLLVMRFVLLNSGNEVQNVDTMQDNIKYTVVADEYNINAMITMLSNDLTTYLGNIAPDESREVVLLAEMEEELAMNADGISVVLSRADSSSVVTVK